MKKPMFCLLLALSLAACKKETKETTTATDSTATEVKTETPASTTDAPFDINTIPVSTKEPGTFPYLAPPEKYSYNYQKEANPKDIKDPDKEYFAVNGKLIPREGKTYKINIDKESSEGLKFNALEVEKYYDSKIKELGGVQVDNNARITQEEYDRIGQTELITKHYGSSINVNLLDQIKTYVIRTKDKVIWVQFSLLDNESGNITVLEEAVK